MLEQIRIKIHRLKYYAKKDVLTFNNVVLFFALVICFHLIWGAISSMSRNWALEEKLKNKQLEATRLEIEVQTLELEQEYYKTDEYKELMARSKAGKMLPGETMVILPKNSESAIKKYSKDSEDYVRQSNFLQWLDFLFG